MGFITRDLGRTFRYHLQREGNLANCEKQTFHMNQSNHHGPQTGISGVGDYLLQI